MSGDLFVTEDWIPMEGCQAPFSLGFIMPAEWARHKATWLSWPKNPDSFPKEVIRAVELAYVRMIEELVQGENVNILVDDETMEKRAAAMLSSTKKVFFHKIKTIDIWTRDYGPIFVKSENKTSAVKWDFNAWGNKYEDLKEDDKVGMEIARIAGYEIFKTNIILEGGSIDVNGSGSAITTEQCLLNRNRNPKLAKHKIENYLKDCLGIINIIWLKEGITGDDTDGHVDDVARFVNKSTVVAMVEENKNDENYEVLKTNFELLQKSKDESGNRLNIIPIPMPRAVRSSTGRLPASYANFYIANDSVLVPTFDDRNDEKALSIIGRLFPTRKVIGVDCRALVYGFGAIHCVTMQEPL